ncbi:MAG: hypothetical protein GDA53_11840 [Rhodobacteraceae bacterium]|nr:hypothetical protein [Paracoccaceae bacterium]
MARIRGGFGNDNLVGNGDNEGDWIQGFSGNDTLTGDDTDDTLDGGPGNDTLNGGGGADRLDAGYGTDILNGGAGNDLLGFGGDLLDGEQDTVDGGPGRDRIDYTNVLYFAVHVDLSTGLATDTDGTQTVLHDIIRNIENIVGGDLDDTLTGDTGNNHIRGDAGADTLDGGAGRDTASYYGSTAGVDVNLGTTADTDGYVTARGGDAQGDKLRNFENLVGSDHNDTLTGDAGNNRLKGAGGADTLDGGAGRDRAIYKGSDAGVSVSLVSGATNTGGDAAGDVLRNIENLVGSDHNDTLTGDAGNNVIRGDAGGDTLDGGAGNDRLDYSKSDAAVTANLADNTAGGGHAQGDVISNFEHISGSAFADSLTGNDERNVFAGGAGADTIDGGAGRDVVSYRKSDAGVRIDLGGTQDANGFITASGGTAEGDKLKNVEHIVGSAFDDVLKGHRVGGADGKSIFRGGGGADEIRGRGGRDTADYRDSGEGVTVSLIDGTVNSGGTAEGDRLYSIENVRGSHHNDTLIGNEKDNIITGGRGADTMTGGERPDGRDFDTFIFKEGGWDDGDVITDFDLTSDTIRYEVDFDTDPVSFARHDANGDGTNDSVTVTLSSTGNVLLLRGVDYDVLMDDSQVGADGLAIFF